VSEQFRCDNCDGTFDCSDEAEAVAELKANFGEDETPAMCGIVCDDCYKAILEWRAAEEHGL